MPFCEKYMRTSWHVLVDTTISTCLGGQNGAWFNSFPQLIGFLSNLQANPKTLPLPSLESSSATCDLTSHVAVLRTMARLGHGGCDFMCPNVDSWKKKTEIT